MWTSKSALFTAIRIAFFFMEIYGNCSIDKRFDSQFQYTNQYYRRRSKYLITSIAELQVYNDKTFKNFETQVATGYIRTNIICDSLTSQNSSNFNDLIMLQCRDGYCSVIVENSTIDVINSTLFPVRVKILQLFLNRTDIREIETETFDEILGLRELYLQDNLLTEVAEGIFNSLTNLTLLHLGRNKISVVHEYALPTNLKILYLNDNNISKLANNEFKIVPKLLFLDISNNPCETASLNLATVQFDGSGINLIEVLPEITMSTVSLQGNNNVTIEIELNVLKRLNLSKNKLTHWNRIFNISTNFNYLNLSSNIITELDENGFAGLYKLIVLDLSNNQLVSLSHGLFADLSSLQWLDLSQNKIISFQYGLFDSLKLLKLLNVSKNVIGKEFNLNPFRKSSLAFLYLDNNKIETLTVDNFSSYNIYFFSIKEVSLDNNSWSCGYLEQLIHNWNLVKIVDGSSQKTHNVKKIKCDDKFENPVNSKTSVKVTDINKTVSIVNSQFEKSLRFFNDDFRQSAFFKFFNDFNNTILTQYLGNRDNDRENDIRNISADETRALKLLSSLIKDDHFVKSNETFKYLTVIALYAILILLVVVVYFTIFKGRFNHNRTAPGDHYLEALL